MKNKLKIFGFLLSFIFLSCSSFNEFGLRRNNFDIEKIKPNKNESVYGIIDTSKIYKLVKIN